MRSALSRSSARARNGTSSRAYCRSPWRKQGQRDGNGRTYIHRRQRDLRVRRHLHRLLRAADSARLLISPDLSVFRAHRLAGPAARNKGMALFPRKVHGQHLALCRSDGERTSLASSPDGYV
jgi:hypothetical protein